MAGRRRQVRSNLAAKLPSTTEEEQTDRNLKWIQATKDEVKRKFAAG